jgi:NADH dehydrogenase/NADH:ubiquinone oxidoreductase subunit G
MEENIVNITINGEPIMAKRHEKVLEVARRAGYDIPTLCFLKGINETANCRMCVVEADINGRPMRGLPASCALEVAEGNEYSYQHETGSRSGQDEFRINSC